MHRISGLSADKSDEVEREQTPQNDVIRKQMRPSIFEEFVSYFYAIVPSILFGFSTKNVLLEHNETAYYSQELLDARKALLGLEEDDYKVQYLIDECNNNISTITHCSQETTWDCGVTCCQMVLRWIQEIGQKGSDIYAVDMDYEITPYGYSSQLTDVERAERKWMLELLNTTSIWTIDLVTLLHKIFLSKKLEGEKKSDDPILFQEVAHRKFDVSLLFCTKKTGVDHSHKDLNYYEGDFLKDVDRVTSLFQFTREQNIPILETDYMQMVHVVDFVSRSNCIAIALLDNNILVERRAQSKFHQIKSKAMGKKSFTGHYVVICGISTDERDIAECKWQDKESNYCFIVKNPGSVNATDFISPSHFEKVGTYISYMPVAKTRISNSVFTF